MFFPILEGHLCNFNSSVKKYAGSIMTAAVTLHGKMLKHFLPNAVKFHYQWNLRELTNIFQGIMQASSACISSPAQLSRLWLHEATRTYGDRLMTAEDSELFEQCRLDVATKTLGDCGMDMPTLLEEPLLFASFCQDGDDYQALQGSTKLKAVLTESLSEYNESNARMDLVLFENFMEHVVRIARIIFKPRGNAMVIGVGGSGKQSITRLTAFIRGISVFQIQLTLATM
jgi:dynein heavy chain